LALLDHRDEFRKEDICVDHLKYCPYCKKITTQQLILFTHIDHDVWVARCHECQNISIDDVICKVKRD